MAGGDAGRGEPGDRVTVFYPQGDCATGWLEVEVFERDREAWRPHPRHPRLRARSCTEEDPGLLLNELRVRCTDPKGAFEPSPWEVGADLRRGVAASTCPGGPADGKAVDGSRPGGEGP